MSDPRRPNESEIPGPSHAEIHPRSQPHTTIPAPAIPPHSPPPSDLAASLEERGPGQPHSADPKDANAELVRHALAAFSQGQADFMAALNVRLDEYSRLVGGLKTEIKAVGDILSARLDATDELLGKKIDTLGREAGTIAHAVNEHTEQIREVLLFANKTYDMTTSNARKTDLIREHLGIPDELDAQGQTEDASEDRSDVEGH